MSNDTNSNSLELTLGMLLLRIWLAMRAIQAGIEKFAGTREAAKDVEIDGKANDYGLAETITKKYYALENYHGVPAAMNKQFEGEPFIPSWGLIIYDYTLGPALLILGFTLLVGICTRLSLFAMGLLYTSLTFGLILLNQSAGVAWLGTHIIMIVAALALVKHNRFALLKQW